MAKLNENKTAVYFLWLVGFVAAVALSTSFLNYLSESNSQKDISGAAVEISTPATSKWTSCLDQGDKIKLTNSQDSLIKTDTCVGDGLITRVSCSEDVYGYFTYKYSSAEHCPQNKKCIPNKAGIASCI